MKFSVDKEKLIQALELATRFVSRNSTLPILENVAIIWKIDTIELKATDMNKFINIVLPANVSSEWAITVNAKMLFDSVRISDWNEIVMEWKYDGTVLTIISDNDKFEFKGISINEYVAVPEIEEENLFMIDAEILWKWIERVESSIPDKSFNTIITWMLLKSKSNSLSFVWTDSFRLAEYIVNDKFSQEFELVIPKHVLSEIKKVSDLSATKNDANVKIKYDTKMISFFYKIDDMEILIKTNLIAGQYPDYTKIILPNYNFKIIIDKNKLEKSIRKVSLFSRDISYFVRFEQEWDNLIISSWETDLWEWVTIIPAIFDWQSIALWLNWKSILDFLKYVEWEEVIFNVFDWEKPVLLKDQWNENYRFVIRPLKE